MYVRVLFERLGASEEAARACVCDKASMVLARGPGARAGGMKLKFSIEGEKKRGKEKVGWMEEEVVMEERVCGTGRNKG